ncbi:hypothetical protein B0A55_05595 [Friedmanniomyces simplex]|uniref:F-box domain-containing protein n=1 Tax=Friedmanniomyces simplex TaxID=329884 RepID=A0A4U0XG74_9PEZI|nr:hypothetical protein B0A55_05595 [Friedmanniomyces simplex]
MEILPFRLFDLADELIVNIIEHLHDDLATLRALALCSRRLQSLSEPLLYRRRFLRIPSSVDRLLQTTNQRPPRAECIHDLEVRCQLSRSANDGFASLPLLLEQATNLRSLTLESPFCNSRALGAKRQQYAGEQDGVFALFHRAAAAEPLLAQSPILPFQHLRSVELHLTGSNSRYCMFLYSRAGLFLSPTLHELTLSCAKFFDVSFEPSTEGGSDIVLGKEGTTPLKRLTMIECDITSLRALACILALPKALEFLHIGENCHHRFEPAGGTSLCSQHPVDFFDRALACQQHSLEELVYEVPFYDPSPPHYSCRSSQGFRNFRKLHTVTCTGLRCPAFEEALWGGDRRAPQPPLRTLKIGWQVSESETPQWFADDDGASFISFFRSLIVALPGLRDLQLTCRPSGSTNWLEEPQRTSSLEAFALELRSKGVLFRLYEKGYSSCYPPYLYNETPGKDELMYASDERGFTRDQAESGGADDADSDES